MTKTQLVGIGTPLPTEKLHISGAGVIKQVIESSDDSATLEINPGASKNANITLQENGTQKWLIQNVYGDDKLFIKDEGNTVNLAIQQDGKVGIGTENPQNELEVHGNIEISGSDNFLRLRRDASSGQYSQLHHDTSDNKLKIVGYSGTKVMPSSATADGLEIEAQSSQEDNYLFAISSYNGTGDLMYVSSSGLIGIGTATPTSLLHLKHNTAPNIRQYRHDNTQVWEQTIDSNNRWILREAGSEGGTLYERLTIEDTGDTWLVENGGNVGINTKTPSEKLHIEGNISASGNLKSDDVIRISVTSGSVTNPEAHIPEKMEALDITGSIKVSSDITIGDGATPGNVMKYGSTNVSANDGAVLNTFRTGSYRTAKYIVQATKDGANEYQSTELLVTHNSTGDAYISQYNTIDTNPSNELCTYEVAIFNQDLRVIVSSSVDCSIKYDRTILPI